MAKLSRYNINLTIDKLVDHINNDYINFDMAVKRGFTWDIERKRLLILSILEDLKINIMLFSLKGDENRRYYDVLDGKQRSNAIATFLGDDFDLGENSIAFDKRDMEHDLSGMKFSELPEWAQNRIMNYSLDIYCYDGLSEEQATKLYYRFNSGKPLYHFDLTRIKAPSLKKFQALAKHDVVELAVTESGKRKFTNEDIAIKAWAICFVLPKNESMSLEGSLLRPVVESTDVEDGEIAEITHYFDTILRIYNAIDKADDRQRRIAKLITMRTHLIGMTRLVMESYIHAIEEKILTEWVKVFFDGDSATTIDPEYNAASGPGSMRRDKIDTRVNAMLNHLIQFAKTHESGS